jgi:hypothetical protein
MEGEGKEDELKKRRKMHVRRKKIKGGDGSERMKRERKYKFMLFYLLRNFAINKKF